MITLRLNNIIEKPYLFLIFPLIFRSVPYMFDFFLIYAKAPGTIQLYTSKDRNLKRNKVFGICAP